MSDPNVIEAIKVLSEQIYETAQIIAALICAVGVLIIVSIPSHKRIIKEIFKEKI